MGAIGDRRDLETPAPSGALKPHLAHQALDRAPCDGTPFAIELSPDLVGAVDLDAIPQVRGSDESYRCTLYDVLRGDSEMVQRLATEMYARGLSTRDIEDAFTDEQGRCLLSRSKVSEVTEVLWEQYEAFQNRDLSDLPLLCLFLDGLYEPLRTHGITREAILCAWGITLDGRKVLISLALGNKESGVAACPHLCSSPPTARQNRDTSENRNRLVHTLGAPTRESGCANRLRSPGRQAGIVVSSSLPVVAGTGVHNECF